MSTHTITGSAVIKPASRSEAKAAAAAKKEKIHSLSKELAHAQEEYRCALKNFEYLYDTAEVDICTYAILSAQCKYERILKQLRRVQMQ